MQNPSSSFGIESIRVPKIPKTNPIHYIPVSIECVNTVFKYCFEDDTYMSFIIENLTYHTKQGKECFCCWKILLP